LICPNCKNEYFGNETCPSCGLTEEHALRRTAEELLRQERYAMAAEHLGRILHRNPHDVEVWKMQAGAYARMALISRDPMEMAHAEVVLRETVNLDWEWETGHQFRIQIADKSDRLDELVREYRAIAQDGTSDRSATAVRMIQVIQLTLQFKSEMPQVRGLKDPLSWRDYGVAFWPLLIGLPFTVISTQSAIQAYQAKEPVGPYMAMVFAGIFGTVFLLFFTLRRMKEGRGGRGGEGS
jgi:hypothetical protein